MAKVALKNVSKFFGSKEVIKNFNLEVQDQEFLVLVGPSGCGKSTILRMISGLEETTSGEIYIGDILVNPLLPKDRDTAMVFQNYALYPHMTVFENLAFPLKMKKYPKEEIKKRVEETAEILELKEFLPRKPKQLSGGQRQRVAVGRAIVRKPKVFLFDEPLSNLDAKLRVQMRGELIKLHRRLKATIIYVTHDQIEAMTLGQRIVVLKDGEIQQIDTPLNLYNNPLNRFVASFIGSPSMNFLKGKVFEKEIYFEQNLQIKIPENKKETLKNYSGREIFLGIRPEDIHLKEPKNIYFEMSAKLEFSEQTGSDTFLYFEANGQRVAVRQNFPESFSPEQIKTLFVNLEKTVLFDAETDETIFQI
jgi:multiple sugar transport system ATP-binding protein